MPRYIDADDAILELERAFPIDDYGKIIRCISRTQTADVVERKVGKWIKYKTKACWYCSECAVDNYYAYVRDCDSGEYEQQDNFCPNCGAEMEE